MDNILQILEKCEKLTVDEKNSLYNLFVSYHANGDYATASRLIEGLLISEPSNSTYLKSAASCYQLMKNYMGAYLFYNYAYILSGENECLYYMSSCLVELKEYVLAKVNLEKLLNSDAGEKLCLNAKLLIKFIDSRLT